MGYLSRFPGGSAEKIPEIEYLWTAETGNTSVRCMDTDGLGYVYSGATDGTVRKFDKGGREVWCCLLEFPSINKLVAGVACNSDGSELRATCVDSTHRAIKDGLEIWRYTGAGNVSAVIDGEYSYSGKVGIVYKHSATGDIIFSVSGVTGYCLAVDAEGNVFGAGTGGRMGKIDRDGQVLWSESVWGGSTFYCISITPAGDICVGGLGNRLMRLSRDKEEIWRRMTPVGGSVRGISSDSDENIHVMTQSGQYTKVNKCGFDVRQIASGKTSCMCMTRDLEEHIYFSSTGTVCKVILPVGVLIKKAGGASSRQTVYRMVDSGDPPWERTRFVGHTMIVSALAVDGSKRIYSGSSNRLIARDKVGEELWSWGSSDDGIHGIALDVDGMGIYLAGYSSQSVQKLDRDGVELWAFQGHTSQVRTVAACSLGGVYSAGSDMTLRRIGADGEEIWSLTAVEKNPILGIASDQDGNIYLACANKSARKVDVDGVAVWQLDVGVSLQNAVVSPLGGIAFCGSSGTVLMTRSDGTEVWRATIGVDVVQGLEADKSGKLYAGAKGVWALDSGGSLLWALPENVSTAVKALAVDEEGRLLAGVGNDVVDLRQVYKIY